MTIINADNAETRATVGDTVASIEIDLSAMPSGALRRQGGRLSVRDPWTEGPIAKDVEKVVRAEGGEVVEVFTADVVTITLDEPLTKTSRGVQRLAVTFGPGRPFATLEAVRAWVRERVAWEKLSDDERLDRELTWMAQEEREAVTEYALMRSVCVAPGMNFRALSEHMRANGWAGKDQEIRDASVALRTGDYGSASAGDEPVQPLVVEKGARGASLHYPHTNQSAEWWSEAERVRAETGDAPEDQAVDEEELAPSVVSAPSVGTGS